MYSYTVYIRFNYRSTSSAYNGNFAFSTCGPRFY